MKRRTGRTDQNGVVHALLYTRVSGAEHQKEGLSLEAQTRATRGYAAIQTGWVIGGEYRDILSGARDDRPQYQAMLAEARRLHGVGNRAVVVVTRLDRLGRHLLEQVRAREELQRMGCDTHAIREGGLLPDLTANILLSVAQDERQRIGVRVAEVRADLVANGWFYTAGRAPFGYRTRPATAEERAAGSPRSVIEPDPSTRGVAVEVYQRVANGQSVNSVARWLAGLPEGLRGGRLWPAAVVTGMLRSPTYAARAVDGVDDVLSRPRTRWEPLVSDELWAAVQATFEGHARRPHQASGRFLLTGFLRCPVCGERMRGTAKERKERPGVIRSEYRCSAVWRGANARVPGCQFAVPMAAADQLVLDQVAALLDVFADPERVPALRRAWAALEQPPADTTRQLAELQREIATAQRRLADAATLLVDGTLDRLGYEALRDRETARVKSAEMELARLQSTSNGPTERQLPPLSRVLALASGWARIWREVDIVHQRDILDQLMVRIVVHRTGYRQYGADVTWTPLGAALATVASDSN